jgi:hypothetical protein
VKPELMDRRNQRLTRDLPFAIWKSLCVMKRRGSSNRCGGGEAGRGWLLLLVAVGRLRLGEINLTAKSLGLAQNFFDGDIERGELVTHGGRFFLVRC